MATVDSDSKLEQLYVSSLFFCGVTLASLQKLKSAGIHSCHQILIKTREFLDGVESLEEYQPDKIWSAAESVVALIKEDAQTEMQRVTEALQNAAMKNTCEVTLAAIRDLIHCFSEYFSLIEIQRYMQEKHSFAPEGTATIFNGHISDNTEDGLSYLSHAVVASRQREPLKRKCKMRQNV